MLGLGDQCWTLARIAELLRRRFGVECTLAGLDLLLHRMGRKIAWCRAARQQVLPAFDAPFPGGVTVSRPESDLNPHDPDLRKRATSGCS